MAKNISSRAYAEAYLESLEKSHDAVAEVSNCIRVLKIVPSLGSYLADRGITGDDKIKALRIALPEGSEQTMRFVILLATQRALDSLERIVEHVKELTAAQENRLFAEVTSAVALTTDEVTRIAKALQVKLGKAVLLETHIEPELIGGLTIRIGDWIYDSSLKGRIERLQQQLLV